MERKRRILFIGEASYIATGFGTYWQAVIQRLHATGEFEIAELGSYAYDGDPKNLQVPWKFYPVAPAQDDEAGNKAFGSRSTNQFGEWRFDDVCIEFKPDIVVGIRDWWMDEFALRSPFRHNFKFIWMPTIDGDPQKESWLDSYRQCDKVLTYSEWGMKLLQQQARAETQLVTVASPGADLDVFSPPSDKAQHKAKLGIQPDTIIVGTVMRNQKRKLYYDLIQAFSGWLHKSKTKGHTRLAAKTFLYLHTSYPDVGYDIGRAVREFEVGNKVIMTYLCANCGMAFPAFFSGQTAFCRKCNQPKAHPPNASHHVPRHILADIMKTFDLYVQYSICEGWGMPLTEAQACGIPTMAVKYSAMEDHLDSPTAIPIKVERFFYEAIIETEQRRALPSNEDFIAKLDNFLKRRPEQQAAMRQETRDYIVEPVDTYGQADKMPRRSWDRTAAIWKSVLQECDIYDPETTWLHPQARIHKPTLTMPKQDMNNTEFVKWVIGSIWNRPDFVNTYFAGEWVTALNTGFKNEGNQRMPIDRSKVVDHFMEKVRHYNTVEQKRLASLQTTNPNQVAVTVM